MTLFMDDEPEEPATAFALRYTNTGMSIVSLWCATSHIGGSLEREAWVGQQKRPALWRTAAQAERFRNLNDDRFAAPPHEYVAVDVATLGEADRLALASVYPVGWEFMS